MLFCSSTQTWCTTCKGLDTALNTADLPDGLTILKTDYDKETDLKKKYGVTTQHTLVQVDAQGNKLAKWSGSRSL